jgi:hypothetical protein
MPIRADFLYGTGMARRRLKRKHDKTQRHTAPVPRKPLAAEPAALFRDAERFDAKVVVRQAQHVERLAYTRTQAAVALGISRTTFNRHVLPYVETIEIGSGARLIPIDELQRYTAERRRSARRAEASSARLGRPGVLPDDLVEQIRTAHAAGRSLAQITRELNAAGKPTAHGGARWWPSTVRAVVDRVSPPPGA